MPQHDPPPCRLETEHLAVHFGDRSALEDVTLQFRPYEIVGLVGPNGAGKSTLLRTLAGIQAPSHGIVRYEGEALRGVNPCVVYVPQRTSVDWTFPISVIDVVLMARMHQRSRFAPYSRNDRNLAMRMLERVGMERLAGVQINQLSGGQQQRVFLARALLAEGDVYLLDEPYTGIDGPTQDLISHLFEDLCSQGKAVIAATHDLEHAAGSMNRIIVLNRHVVADGPPEVSLAPEVLLKAYGDRFRFLHALETGIVAP
jgi:ABC-type Mn2+/Zn2+ transport system ATPase subunit